MEIRTTCPFGSDCETPKDGHIERCAWYTKLVGKDPQSGKDVDEWRCAIAWMPIMSVESSNRTRGVQQATESFRNEMVKGQAEFNNLIGSAINTRNLLDGS